MSVPYIKNIRWDIVSVVVFLAVLTVLIAHHFR